MRTTTPGGPRPILMASRRPTLRGNRRIRPIGWPACSRSIPPARTIQTLPCCSTTLPGPTAPIWVPSSRARTPSSVRRTDPQQPRFLVASSPGVRSLSMNNFVGAPSRSGPGFPLSNPQGTSKYPPYQKMADIVSPTMTFVFLDERPDSINDGTFSARTWTTPFTCEMFRPVITVGPERLFIYRRALGDSPMDFPVDFAADPARSDQRSLLQGR